MAIPDHGALAFGQRQREIRALRNLPAPNRNVKRGKFRARLRDGPRLHVLALRRRCIDNHRIRFAGLAREFVEIEDAGARCGSLPSRPHVRRGVDEHSLGAVAPGGLDDVGDAALRRFQWQRVGVAQLVP